MFKLITIITLVIAITLNSCSYNSKVFEQKTKVQNKFDSLQVEKNRKLLKLLNTVRAEENNCSKAVDKLILDEKLSFAAQMHSIDMGYNHFVRHDGSGTETDEAKQKLGIGSLFNDRLVYFGFRAPRGTLSGENVVKIDIENDSNTLESNFKKALYGLTLSQSQCKILMNPQFKYVGIGYFNDGISYYWTIDYAQRRGE